MNIYDIAEKASVSIATVSRVLNGSEKVSLKTRQKVEAVLKEMNFRPSAIARGMVTNSMKTVGVLAIDIRDIYYANVTYTIEQQIHSLGYNVILCNTGQKIQSKKHYIKMLIDKKVDGIILVGSVFRDESLRELIESTALKLPVVLLNGWYDIPNVYCVLLDDKKGIEMAVEHVRLAGKSKPIYLTDTNTYSANQKAKGFPDKKRIFHVKKGLDGGYNAIRELMQEGVLFDSILSSEDITSVGAMKYLLEQGVRVPEDVAVMGFNNSIFSACAPVEMTSIDSKMQEIGSVGAKTLIDVLSKITVPPKRVLEAELIVRRSTIL